MKQVADMRFDDRWVVAIGGNALADPHDPTSLTGQEAKTASLAVVLVDALASGVRLVLVHGNGPQVGARLIQNEAAADQVPPSPLQVCVAETQGEIGHYLSLGLRNELRRRGLTAPVVCLLTHVQVDPHAPEFERPDKPVGPVYDEDTARGRAAQRGWQVEPVAGGGWRRVVASPRPLRVMEIDAVDALLRAGACVIAGGGGGVPVAGSDGALAGVEAVVDKDYTAELLATAVKASRLVVLTDVAGAALSFGRPEQRFLREMTAAEAGEHLARGEFAPGSMAPKVEACLAFLAAGGREAVIAALADAPAALVGRTGTVLRGR